MPDPTASYIDGAVSDGAGSKRLGGEGSIAAASRVEARSVANDGSTELIGEADVMADGSWSMATPPSSRHVVLTAVDAEGEAIASAMFEETGPTGTTRSCEPFTSESSLEAAVFTSLRSRGRAAEDINTIEIRNRVDAAMATAVRDADDADQQRQIDVIADGVIAADRAESRVYASSDVDVSSHERWEAQLPAVLAYHEARASAGGEAHAELLNAVEQSERDMNADDELQARGELAASAAFRGVVAGVDDAETEQACDQEAAESDARKTTNASIALLTKTNASTGALDLANQASAELRTRVEDADTRADIDAAFETYADAMVGADTGMSSSVLATLLDIDLASQTAAELAIDEVLNAETTLVADLGVALDDASASGVVADVDGWSDACADAYLSYFASLEAQSEAFTALDRDQGEAALGVAAVTEAAFAGSY